MNTSSSNYTAATVGAHADGAGYEWWRFVIIVGLSILSAIFSGLNLAIIGLDVSYLELLIMGPFETKEDE